MLLVASGLAQLTGQAGFRSYHYIFVTLYFETKSSVPVSRMVNSESYAGMEKVMSGAKLNIEWKQTDMPDGFSAPVRIIGTLEEAMDRRVYTRQISSAPTALKCPRCESVIYSRSNRLCGLCGEALPEGLLFSAAESRRIKNILNSEKRRHKGWMLRIGTSA